MGQLYRPTTTRPFDLNSFPPLYTERLQLRELTANVHPQNLPSQALLERLGFTREGVLREAGFWAGCYQDLQVFSLLSHEH